MAGLEHRNVKDAAWENLEGCHALARSLGQYSNLDIDEMRSWAIHGLGLTLPKPSSPTIKSGSRILRGYCGARNLKSQPTWC